MSEMPKRKRNRLAAYDYNRAGAYFITLCTYNKECVLSRIVGDDALGVPTNRLTKWGSIAEEYILSGNRMDRVTVDKYVIMPNHIHILLIVEGTPNGTPGASSPTAAVVPRFVSALKRLTNQKIGKNIFQRSYHDHVIRNQQDYLRIWEYMDNNPKKWKLDCFYVKERADVSEYRQ